MDILKPELVWIEGRCYRINLEYSFESRMEERLFVDDIYGKSMLSTRLKYIFS